MLHRHLARTIAALALVTTSAALGARPGDAATTPAVLGPPWISIEYPVNPYDNDARGAYLMVHAFHHQLPTGFPVEGRAEGLVAGARKTVTLEFRATSKSGVYALTQQWPKDGSWVLVIDAKQGENDRATALVEIGKDGRLSGVRVPTRPMNNGYPVPAGVTAADVDAALLRVSRTAAN